VSSVLLVTSNGTGMGHLTRQAAVALSLPSGHEATLFSLSIGLPSVLGLGLEGEYCPSYDRPWIASGEWHSYLCDRLLALIDEIDAEAVLFDGVAPYPGIYRASRLRRQVPFIWLRRGMWRRGANIAALEKTAYFDLVIEPGDLGSDADVGPTTGRGDAMKVRPISILEPLGITSREEARRHLGLPPDGPIALLTLGSGRLGDVAGPGSAALTALLDNTSDWHIAVTRSPVALNDIPIAQADRLTELEGVYPLATYLSAFDVAISSAGYNSVHELVPAGLPSLLVANTSTRTDDQAARARSLENQGLALAALDTDPQTVAAACRKLVTEEVRGGLIERTAPVKEILSGASETGAIVTGSAGSIGPRRRTLGELLLAGRLGVKERTKEMLGPDRTWALKRMLGRGGTAPHGRATVNLVFSPRPEPEDGRLDLTMVDKVTGELLRSQHPVEHVLEGSSELYHTRRREIIDRYYDVVDEAPARPS
jgi:UDP:flavonoid glycosyltransferase YjiC (YdhE family)